MSKRLYSGRYEFQEFIADDEIGAVYKAWDNTSVDHMVALQVIYSHLSSDANFIEQFREAARKTAQLKTHPNIIKVFDVEHDHGIDYLVMEYFPSANLRDEIRSRGKFHIQEATHVIRQIGEALSHTHSYDLLHRDVKPANILIDNNQHVKLTNFGVAKAMSDAPLTATGELIGTLKYMAPEQASHLPLDGKTDLYSLGMVFYELVTGKTLWNNTPNLTIYSHLQNEQTVPPLNFTTSVPEDIQEIIKDLLRFDPTKRINNARTLVTRLDNLASVLSNDPLVKALDDSDTTILRLPREAPVRQGDATAEEIHRVPTRPSSTQEPPAPLQSSGTKQTSDPSTPTPQQFEDDPAAKAKDPAKPYYFVDDSHSFNKHREEVEANNLLFSEQFPVPDPHSSHSLFSIKSMLTITFIVLVGVLLYRNQSFFIPSQTSQDTLVLQEIENSDSQEPTEHDVAEIQDSELKQPATTISNTQTTEIVQQTNVVPDVQTTNVTEHVNTTDNAQITKHSQQTAAGTNLQTEELTQQAKVATDTQAAERALQAKIIADAQAAKLATQAQAAAKAQTAKKIETQALMTSLERLRGTVAKKDLVALKQQSTMSESRYRMLKDLFARYRTVEISLGDVRRTHDEATAIFQITKLIRPNGVIVRPHPIVRNIKVTVRKDNEDWDRPAW